MLYTTTSTIPAAPPPTTLVFLAPLIFPPPTRASANLYFFPYLSANPPLPEIDPLDNSIILSIVKMTNILM